MPATTRRLVRPDDDDTEGIFFIASLKPQDYREMMRDLRYNKWFTYDHFEYLDLIREGEPRLDDTQILVDDKPRLEMLNAQNILQWRQTKVQEHMRPMLRYGVPIYR